MSLFKRKRSANWMTSEKRLLLDLVTEYFSVIENKKTDGVSMKEKQAEWVKISNEYNSQTTMTHRTADNLKAQWESLKKSAKKKATNNRMELLKTGGGPPEEKAPKEKREDPISSRILSLINTSAVGLSNPLEEKKIEAITMQMQYAREERKETRRLNNVQLLIKKQVLKRHQIQTRLLLLKLRAAKKGIK